MKKFGLTSILIFIILYAGFVAAKHFWRGETMSQSKVEKKWGGASFNKDKFKNGGEQDRASMAYSMLKNQKLFVGKDRAEIRKELGDPDGFYFTDMFPAYLISRGEKEGEDSWQIVFLLDRHEKVSEVIVHKNCCDQ